MNQLTIIKTMLLSAQRQFKGDKLKQEYKYIKQFVNKSELFKGKRKKCYKLINTFKNSQK
jgi:hypothetical protein